MDSDGVADSKSRDKLIARKQQWAAEGRLLTAPGSQPERRRLPPGQHLVKNWPVLDLGNQPAIDKRDWSLSFGGEIEAPGSWRWEDFCARPRVRMTSDIHCVTAWSRYDNQWEGVSTRAFIDHVRPRASAKFVIMKSYDGYTTNVPIADFAASDVLLATHWEGEPISREHGGPVRLVLPALYFWKSPKWIRHIWFAEKNAPGFWEVRGYHMRGDPWVEQRYGHPDD